VGYRIRSGIEVFGSAIEVIGFLACVVLPTASQANPGNGPASIVSVSASGSPRAAEEIVREIHDPATGDRWLLERDPQRSGGPGRMVLVAREKGSPAPAEAFHKYPGNAFGAGAPAALIHAGDHLVVEEHTRLLDAVLEGVALAPARRGVALRVRLTIGGRIVRAVAVAPGRAVLSPDSGASQ